MSDPKPVSSQNTPNSNLQNSKLQSASRKFTAGILGALFGLACAIAVYIAMNERLNEISMQEFQTAQETWNKHAFQDYDLQVELTGRQAATFDIRVRSGAVDSVHRNGAALKNRRTFDTWSIEGMLGTIAVDLEQVQKVQDGSAPAGTPRLLLRGILDPEFGFPRKYLRIEMHERGENPTAAWEITKFDVYNGDKSNDGS